MTSPFRIIENTPPADFTYAPPNDPLNIIYEDDHILVLDKPFGLLSVPGRTPDLADCLESRTQKIYPHATTIHRLDMETSGILIMGLTPIAHKRVSRQFETRAIKKTYIAELCGELKNNDGIIDLPLRCDWPNRPKQMVDFERGKKSITRYEVISRTNNQTRVKLFPETGRSHQLRVHMLYLGHPIAGDSFYGGDETHRAAERLKLHAYEISIYHPHTNEWISFTSPCPF